MPRRGPADHPRHRVAMCEPARRIETKHATSGENVGEGAWRYWFGWFKHRIEQSLEWQPAQWHQFDHLLE